MQPAPHKCLSNDSKLLIYHLLRKLLRWSHIQNSSHTWHCFWAGALTESKPHSKFSDCFYAVPVTHQQISMLWPMYTLIISECSCELSWTELMVNLLPLCVAWHSLDMTQPLSPREPWELLMEHFGYLIKMWTLSAAKILFWPTTAPSQCQTQLGDTDSTRSWHNRYWPGLLWVSLNYSPSFIPVL